MRKYLIGFLLLLLAVTVGWGYKEKVNREHLGYALEAEYQREFYDVIEQVEQVEVLLAKILVSNSPRLNALYLTETWSRAFFAQNALAQLPFKGMNLAASRKFLAQVGDYSRMVARELLEGKKISEEYSEQLARFHTEMGSFAQELHRIEKDLNGSRFRWSDKGTTEPIGQVAMAVDQGELHGFADFNKRMEELPVLVYDGPFSDHLEQRQPRSLTGEDIDAEEATKRALAFIDAPPETFQIVSRGETDGKIPGWSVTLRRLKGPGTINLDISKKGGHIIWMLDNRSIDQQKISSDEAGKRAATFLEQHGLKSMQPVSTLRQGNTQAISFVYTENQVRYYPDQIKVKVALDNGQVVGFEALSYRMAHGKRQLPDPKLSKEEVKEKINSSLQVEDIRLAVIPLVTGQEILAYEVKASRRNDVFLIYVNAWNGEEEQIFKVINEQGGQLTI